jgi:hypothetical protein
MIMTGVKIGTEKITITNTMKSNRAGQARFFIRASSSPLNLIEISQAKLLFQNRQLRQQFAFSVF